MIATLKDDHALTDLLTVAGMARSTFYYHHARLDSPDRHAELKACITRHFTAAKSRYGYRRIRLMLHQDGSMVSRKTVWKLMNQLGLKSKVRARKAYSSYRGTVSQVCDNVLKRQFTPGTPNAVWVSDVTEFRAGAQKVYLSPILDLYDRSIVSYSTSTSPSTAFTAQSLTAAYQTLTSPATPLVHTDQGFQYQHQVWRRVLAKHGSVQSMSRRGNCHDNAIVENFFGHLKSEMYHGERFETVDHLVEEIGEYIRWYNQDRVQERLKGLTPMQYRNQALQSQPA